MKMKKFKRKRKKKKIQAIKMKRINQIFTTIKKAGIMNNIYNNERMKEVSIEINIILVCYLETNSNKREKQRISKKEVKVWMP